jgi:hypothetical protein
LKIWNAGRRQENWQTWLQELNLDLNIENQANKINKVNNANHVNQDNQAYKVNMQLATRNSMLSTCYLLFEMSPAHKIREKTIYPGIPTQRPPQIKKKPYRK